MWNDIDLYHAVRDFTTDPVSFPGDQMRDFINELVGRNIQTDSDNWQCLLIHVIPDRRQIISTV